MSYSGKLQNYEGFSIYQGRSGFYATENEGKIYGN